MKIRGLWLVVPWAVFVLIALGWVFYWNYVANEAERQVRAWAFEQTTQGASASIDRVVRHGFPVLMRLELQGVNYAPARGGWRIQTQRADLNVEMLNPQHIIFEAKAPIAISRADGSVTNVTADKFIGSWRTSGGTLAAAGLEADNLVLDDPAQEGTLRAHKVVINVRPDPRAAGAYQVAFDTQQLLLPRPVRNFESFGLEVPSMRAAIVVDHGAALLETSQDDPLGPWREAGGSSPTPTGNPRSAAASGARRSRSIEHCRNATARTPRPAPARSPPRQARVHAAHDRPAPCS